MNILEEATSLLYGDRMDAYAPPEVNFERTVKIAEALTGKEYTKQEIALIMVAIKMAREQHKHKRDNIVDAINYLTIYASFEGEEL